MANAERDQNNIPTLLATLDDGTAPVRVKATTSHLLHVSDGTTGSNFGPSAAFRDGNFIPALLAVSSADGVTPVAVYDDSTGVQVGGHTYQQGGVIV